METTQFQVAWNFWGLSFTKNKSNTLTIAELWCFSCVWSLFSSCPLAYTELSVDF